MKHYINFITKHYKAVFVFMFIITAIFTYYSKYLNIDASAETLLLENDKDLKLTREIHGRYISPDYLVIAFSPKEYMLSEATLATIKSLKETLLKVEGVESITTLLDVALLQSPPVAVSEIVKNVHTVSKGDFNATMVQKELTTSPLYAKNLVSSDFKTTAIVVNLKDDEKYTELLKKRNNFLEIKDKRTLNNEEKRGYEAAKKEFKEYVDSTKDNTHKLIENVRRTIEPYRTNGNELILGGIMMVADDMISFVKNDIAIYGSAILLIMVFMLWIIFRQIRFVVLPIVISFSAVVMTTGIVALVGLDVTVVSSNFVAMQLITTLSLVIHLIVSYREEYALFPHYTQKELIEITLHRMSTPSVFIVLTSVAGFASLMTCDILPIIDLGTMMNIGVSASLFATYMIFPAVMLILPKKEPVLTFDNAFTLNAKFANIVEHHGKTILISVVLIVAFSLYGATKLVVENSFINYFKESTEIYKGMLKIDNALGGTTPLEIVVRFPQIESKNEVKQTQTKENDELSEFADEFKQNEDDTKYWFSEQKMQTILKVHDYLKSLSEIGNVSSLGTLSHVGRILKDGKDFDGFEMALLYSDLPIEFKKILLLPYVNIEHNEARFVVRIIDSNDELRRDTLLKKIKEELHTKVGLNKEDYDMVGMMVLYNNMLQSLFDSQISTLGLALLLLGSMFLFLFRSIKIALLAMSVNMVPISVIFGIMGVMNLPLDIMSITIASIALGITVDNTIHYYYRFREELGKDGDYIASMHRAHRTIAFGMFYYSIATIVGFLVLVTSNFIPTLIFGLLTVIVLIVAIVSDLLFSPYLVLLFKPFGDKKLA